MIDEQQLAAYTKQVKQELRALGAKGKFIDQKVTKSVCINGIIKGSSPDYVAWELTREDKKEQ